MCAYYPQSRESLLTITGVGQVKLNEFGEVFLTVIKGYCQKKGLKEKKKELPVPKSDVGLRSISIGEAFNAGESIESLMKRHELKMGTIINHLEKYATSGNPLRENSELRSLISISPTEQQAIINAFNELGTAYLKPVFDAVGGTVTYDELRLLRLLYFSSQKKN